MNRQQGAVLVTMLLISLVVTLLAISTTENVVQNEKMVFNTRDSLTAFQAAHSALVEGETQLVELTELPTDCSTSCTIYNQDSLPDLGTQTSTWWASNASTYPGDLESVNTAPNYIIEQYVFIPDDLSTEAIASGRGTYFYEVSARGTGRTDDAEVIMQSIYSTRYQ